MVKELKQRTAIINVKHLGKWSDYTVIWEEKELEIPSFGMNAGFPMAKYNKVILKRVDDMNGFEIPISKIGLGFQDILVCAIHREKQKQKN